MEKNCFSDELQQISFVVIVVINICYPYMGPLATGAIIRYYDIVDGVLFLPRIFFITHKQQKDDQDNQGHHDRIIHRKNNSPFYTQTKSKGVRNFHYRKPPYYTQTRKMRFFRILFSAIFTNKKKRPKWVLKYLELTTYFTNSMTVAPYSLEMLTVMLPFLIVYVFPLMRSL